MSDSMLVRLAVGRDDRRGYGATAVGAAAPGVSVPAPDAESVGVAVSVGESVGEPVVVGVTDVVGDADVDGDEDEVPDAVGDGPLVDGVGDVTGEPLEAVGLGVSADADAEQVGVGEEYGMADGIAVGTRETRDAEASAADVVGGAPVSSAVIVAHPAVEVPAGVGEWLAMAVPPYPGLVAPPGALPSDEALFPVPAGVPLPSVPAPPC
jgi:hypothetical protein